MRRISIALLTVLLVAVCAGAQDGRPAAARDGTVTIAVVRDGPSPGTDPVSAIRRELDVLLAESEQVRFLEAPQFDAAWDASRVDDVLARALADPQVDIVLVTGALVGEAAVTEALSKPVVSTFPQRADLYRVFDQDNDRSRKANLSFTLIRQRTFTDLDTFRQMIGGQVIHVAMATEYFDHLKVLEQEVTRLEQGLDIELRPLPVRASATDALQAMPDDVRAVLLARTPRLDDAGRRQLIEGLNARDVLTFSHVGHADVRDGALAARTPDFSRFLARRVALNLHEIIRGISPNELPVTLPIDAGLLINGRTARQVGYSPGRGLIVSAEYLHPEALSRDQKPLTLAEAFRTAEESSPALRISTQNVETASQERELTRSSLYPKLYGTAGAQTVKVPGLEGVIPDSTGSAGLSLRQMIYDDRKLSDSKSSERLLESTREARERDRLDLLGDTGQAYYRLVLERTLFRVERDNLQLTRENLGLARVRVEAGFSGKDEVFRWESEVAKRESELILREGEVEAARVALNQVLGVDQGLRWDLQEREVDPEIFPLAAGGLDPYVDDLAAVVRFKQAMVAFALENSPEMRVLDERASALEIQRKQRKRSWYVPVFSLSAVWNYQFYRSPELAGVDPDAYSVGVYGSYPIYVGGARKHEIRRVESEATRLRQEMELTRDLVERRTRTALQRVGSSFPVIRLTRMAAESARKNFVVVQDKYTQGLVNVTDLLEAQNETFGTEQAASASVHIFLQDLLELQRAISWFEDEKTPQEVSEFVVRIDQAAGQAGTGSPGAERE